MTNWVFIAIKFKSNFAVVRITVPYDWLKASHPFLSQLEHRTRFPPLQAADYCVSSKVIGQNC